MIANMTRLLSSVSRAGSALTSQTSSFRTSSNASSRTAASRAASSKLTDLLNPQNSVLKKDVKMDCVNNAEVKFYDPPYLVREAPFPNYQELNISIKGYDYTVLNTFYKYVERICNSFKVEVVEAYAMPARSYKVKTFQPFSSNLDKEYNLQVYQRIVRVKNLKSTLAPLLFETVQLNLPEGVSLSVNEPSFEEDEFRYVPDIELQEMRQQLDDMTKKPKSEEPKK
jgi:large subunit ribosomal protein L48